MKTRRREPGRPRLAGLVGLAVAFLTGALALLAPPAHLRVDLLRLPGATALRSRCAECMQAGDRIRIALAGAPREASHIQVYRSGELVAACDACGACEILLRLVGRYQVLAVAMDCPDLPAGNFDESILAAQLCTSAQIATATFDAL